MSKQDTSPLEKLKPIITTKEARKLLGSSYKNMGDIEMAEMIRGYEILIRYAVKQYMVHK